MCVRGQWLWHSWQTVRYVLGTLRLVQVKLFKECLESNASNQPRRIILGNAYGEIHKSNTYNKVNRVPTIRMIIAVLQIVELYDTMDH